jgi:hypothetical protein
VLGRSCEPDHLAGARADERQQGLLQRALVQLHLPADAPATDRVEERLQRQALGVQPQLGAGVDGTQVAEHLALVGQQRREAARARLERLDLVGHLAVEELLGLLAGERELAALGAVDEGDVLGEQAVCGGGLGDGGGHAFSVVHGRP